MQDKRIADVSSTLWLSLKQTLVAMVFSQAQKQSSDFRVSRAFNALSTASAKASSASSRLP